MEQISSLKESREKSEAGIKKCEACETLFHQLTTVVFQPPLYN
jgi:hypothetical protein